MPPLLTDWPGRLSCFMDYPKPNLFRVRCDLALWPVSLNFVQRSDEKLIMSSPIRGQGGYFGILIGPKNTNWVEGVESFLTVQLHWISLSGFKGEVENVEANQPIEPSRISDKPQHKLGRGCWDLASWQILLDSFQRFQRSVNVSANQMPERPS